MTTFRFTVASTVISDEPYGYQDTDEILRREDTFYSLITELEGAIFFDKSTASDSGYAILDAAIQANPCGETVFLAERDDNGTWDRDWETKNRM